MSRAIPMACSLSPEELPERLAEMSAVGKRALLAAGRHGELRFRASDGIRRQLEGIIAAESRCCSFLAFDLREDGDELRLTITSPPGGEPAVRSLVEAFVS